MYEDGGLQPVHDMAALYSSERGDELFRRFLTHSNLLNDLFHMYSAITAGKKKKMGLEAFTSCIVESYLESFKKILEKSYALGHVDGLQAKAFNKNQKSDITPSTQLSFPGVLDK